MAKCFESGGTCTNGKPCNRNVPPGFTRCNLHGGEPVAAKLKAESALAALRMPAIEALLLIIERFLDTQCAHCGWPKGDTDECGKIIQAAKVVLDRTGLGPTQKLELTQQSDGSVDLSIATPEELEEMLRLIACMDSLKETWRQRSLGALISSGSALASDKSTVM